MQVLDLALCWLRYDLENRGSHALNLLQSIRLGLVPEENLKSLLEDPEMLDIPGCSSVLKEVVEFQNSDEPLMELSQKYPFWFATRSTITVSFNYYRDGGHGVTANQACAFYMDLEWSMDSLHASMSHMIAQP